MLNEKPLVKANDLVYAGFVGHVFGGLTELSGCSFSGILSGNGYVGAIAAFVNNTDTNGMGVTTIGKLSVTKFKFEGYVGGFVDGL